MQHRPTERATNLDWLFRESLHSLGTMSELVRIELQPLGSVLTVPRGTPLQDVLFGQGVEFPCGGRGRCRGCRVRLVEGTLPVVASEGGVLTEAELAQGWRLGCQTRADSDLKIELAQWETPILADHSSVFDFNPRDGLGVAVDLGTTTVVAQLVDLRTGHVLGVRMGLNAQARHGADIISRIELAVTAGGLETLCELVRQQIGKMIVELLEAAPSRAAELKQVVVVGNTVMHHLFARLDLSPLAHTPFEPTQDGLHLFSATDLGWNLAAQPRVYMLPCLGGFVGSDILAGILATKLHESEDLCALVDLGTNGEIVVGNREGLLCASTAAGPAFEGARISMGMRAATGAISEVAITDGQLRCHVLGGGPARGLCGSGLVDAVAGGLDLARIRPNGRLAEGNALALTPPVTLTQTDIRELQLAKGAIAAGLRLLAQARGTSLAGLKKVYLAGAFGNYINRRSARRIGLLSLPLEKVEPAGNTALLGAKLALFTLEETGGLFPAIRNMTRHLSLHEDPAFQETYVEDMGFPAAG